MSASALCGVMRPWIRPFLAARAFHDVMLIKWRGSGYSSSNIISLQSGYTHGQYATLCTMHDGEQRSPAKSKIAPSLYFVI